MKNLNFTILAFLTFVFGYTQDDCSNAVSALVGTNIVGTINGISDNTCGWDTPATNGEWYIYNSTFDGVINITTDLPQNDGVTYSDDTRISVYEGTCATLSCIAFNDDTTPSNFLSDVSFAVSNGETYYILFDNRWNSSSFEFVLTEYPVSCPDGSLPLADDFNDPNSLLACWNTIDSDGDGFGWFSVDYDLDEDGNPDGNPVAASASWDSGEGPLNPDNWLISYPIDLTPYMAGDFIELNWKARGVDAAFPAEHYTTYVANGDQIADFTTSTVSFSETLPTTGPGAGSEFADRNLDISAFAGEIVYVAFRHHDVSDQFVLNIDDMLITVTLSTNEFVRNSFKHFYDKETDDLTLESASLPFNNIELFNILGQQVNYKTLSNTHETVSLSDLKNGLYFAIVMINNNSKILKIIKQ